MFSTWDQVYFDFLRLWFRELFLILSRVLWKDHTNPRIIESKVGKTPNVQEKHGILPLRLDLRFNCEVKGLG